MGMDVFFESIRLDRHILAFLLGVPRMLMIFQVAPFLGSSVVTGQLRMVIVISLYLILHPMILDQLPEVVHLDASQIGVFFAFGFKEIILGFLMGYLAGLIFWAIQSAGFFMDNQRGASQAEGADPLSQDSTSPTGSLLFQGAVYLFFVTGGFMAFLGVIYASYRLWPVLSFLPLQWSIQIPLFFAERVSWLILQMMLIAGPVAIACLLTDFSLGLINRFASQLNVYVLAMPIKSAITVFLLFLYFSSLVILFESLFGEIGSSILQLKGLLS